MQIKEKSRPTPSESRPVHSTLLALALVQALADQDEKSVIATAAELVNRYELDRVFCCSLRTMF